MKRLSNMYLNLPAISLCCTLLFWSSLTIPVISIADEDPVPENNNQQAGAQNNANNANTQNAVKTPAVDAQGIDQLAQENIIQKDNRNLPKVTKAPKILPEKQNKNIGEVILSLPNKNYMSKDIKWYECHWQGMDTMELDSELKKKLNYPANTKGIFVIEVTLNAAYSGILAGDVVSKVDDMKVTDLKSFQMATRRIQNKSSTSVTILRKQETASKKVIMKKMVFTLLDKNNMSLGFAQAEAAPMISPGDTRPHPYRGKCTNCHAVGEGFQLAVDPDLITLPPPIISGRKARTHESPHEDRGKCPICHQINKRMTTGTVLGPEVNSLPMLNQMIR
ncbi:MAG: PDZ domain-containing protein [Gammaproteobacteria bacterium]|nr:PDZ domain-containing protein [Gammaproteobacteria bacterium]